MTYNRSMKRSVFPLLFLLSLPVLLFSREKALTYMTGMSYTNTILFGDAAWDHLDQINMQTGLIISCPLEGTDKYKSRIRAAFDYPVWARIRQLDGAASVIQLPDSSLRYGASFFAGLEIPRESRTSLFGTAMAVGPTVDFQSLYQSMLITLGVEGQIEGSILLGDNWSFLLGLTLYYNYWGLHTVGDSSRYKIYIKSGWGGMIYPGFRYSY
jgi:hypothetical protein